jgi:hypothetical protein
MLGNTSTVKKDFNKTGAFARPPAPKDPLSSLLKRINPRDGIRGNVRKEESSPSKHKSQADSLVRSSRAKHTND